MFNYLKNLRKAEKRIARGSTRALRIDEALASNESLDKRRSSLKEQSFLRGSSVLATPSKRASLALLMEHYWQSGTSSDVEQGASSFDEEMT
jgi:hypothetical protein